MDSTLGRYLYTLRTDRGLGLHDVAKRISVTPKLLGDIEHDRESATWGTLSSLAIVYDVPQATMLTQALTLRDTPAPVASSGAGDDIEAAMRWAGAIV